MKKIRVVLIVILILFFSGFALIRFNPRFFHTIYNKINYGAHTEAGFNDENFYNCIVDAYKKTENADHNVTLSDSVLASITTTGEYCVQKGITDLTGLEKLTGLVTLNLSNTNPSGENANMISYINTSSNTKLTTLDLSGVGLSSYDANYNSPAITTLNLSNNRINKYSSSESSKLKKFVFDNNNVSFYSSIDLSSESLLENISIKDNLYLNEIILPETLKATGSTDLIIEISNNKKLKKVNLPKEISTTSSSTTSSINISDNGSGLGSNDTIIIQLPEKIISASTSKYPSINLNNNNKLISVLTPTVVNSSSKAIPSAISVSNNSDLNTIDMTLTIGVSNVEVNSNPLLSKVDFPKFSILKSLEVTENGKNLADGKKLELNFPTTITGTTEAPEYPSIIVSGDATMNISDNSNVEKIIFPNISSGTSVTFNINNNRGLKNVSSLLNSSFEYTSDDNIIENSKIIKSIINISNNSDIENIQVPKSSDMQVNITNNTVLNSIDLMNTSVKNLVVDNNSNLVAIDNISLSVSMNAKITNNKALKSLTLKSALTADLSNNSLDLLDVSSSASLTNINVSKNNLTSLDLSTNAKITTIDASSNVLTSIKLPTTKIITSLNLDNNKLQSDGIENLTIHSDMKYLTLSNNDLDKDLNLNTFRSLTELYIDNNRGNLKEIILAKNSGNVYPILKKLSIINSATLETISNLTVNRSLVSVVITGNTKLTSLNLPYCGSGAIVKANNNSIETITFATSSSVNNITTLDLSNNKISTIDVTKLTKLTSLNLYNNSLENLDVSKNIKLTELNIEGTNVLKKSIIVYKNNYFNLKEKNPLTLYTGKVSTITSAELSDDKVKVDAENNIISSNPGDYYANVNYTHDISENNNSYKVKNDIHVVGLKSNNSRYEVIENEENKFVYIENYNSSTDTDSAITSNLLVEGSSELTSFKKDTSSVSGVYSLKLLRNEDSTVLTNFIVVGLSSKDYIINNNTIILLNQEFDISKISFSLTTSTSKIKKTVNSEKTEVSLYYGEKLFKTLSIVNINSTKYKDYLSKEYIYDNNYSIDNLNISNATTSITYKDNCGTDSEKCKILNIINRENNIVKSYDIISLTSDLYKITDEYILVLNNELTTDNINPKSGNLKIEGTEEIPLIGVYYGDERIAQIDVTKVSSKYDLSKDYIIGLNEDFDEIGNFNYLEPNFYLTNGITDYVDNSLIIKAMLNNNTSSVTAKTYSVSKISSLSLGDNFDLNLSETKLLKPVANDKSDYDLSKIVTYVSSNSEVVSVDATGKVTALKPGSANITVSTIDSDTYNRLSSTITINVIDKKIVKFVVDDETHLEYYDDGVVIKLIDKYPKTGYTLKGFSDGTNFYEVDSNYTVTKDLVTLTAIYELNTYSITYKLNGGTRGSSAPTEGEYGSIVTVSNPSKVGYKFNGWTVTGAGSSISGTNLTIGSENVTLTANWLINTYIVSFDADGGVLSQKTKEVTYNEKYGDLPMPSKDGYDFIGWYSDKTYASEITKDSIFEGDSNITLYAKWLVWPKLKVDLNKGSSTQVLKERYKTGANITLVTPTRTNYVFSRWTLVSGNGIINGNVFTVGTEDSEIKALWQNETITVTFNPNGGTVSLNTKEYDYDSEYGDMPIPVREGYTFDGWYTAIDSGNKIISTTVIQNTAHTLYAHWSKVQSIRVTYDNNGGIGCSSISYKVGSTYGKLCIPSKKTYLFVGWYTEETEGKKIEESNVVPSANHILHARYESISNKITNNSNYGINSSMIFNIKEKTNIQNQFNLGSDITKKIYNINNIEKSTGVFATSDKIKFYQNNKEIGNYDIVVKGDVTGTGSINVSDVAKLYQYLKGIIDIQNYFIKAGNVVDSDNSIRINDVAKLYQYVKGNIKEL